MSLDVSMIEHQNQKLKRCYHVMKLEIDFSSPRILTQFLSMTPTKAI